MQLFGGSKGCRKVEFARARARARHARRLRRASFTAAPVVHKKKFKASATLHFPGSRSIKGRALNESSDQVQAAPGLVKGAGKGSGGSERAWG